MLDHTCVITFANTDIHKNYQLEFEKLYNTKFSRIINYTEEDIIGTNFYKNNMQMFQYKKYFGYFLWKPYIIWKTLQSVEEPYILYCDSNLRFKNFGAFRETFLEVIQRQEMFFVKHMHFINKEWTKRDTFFLMDADTEDYWEANQVWTPLMGFSKTNRCFELLDSYMHYCRNPQISTEMENLNGDNLPGFREHRWEQSIMSILAKKYNFSGVPDTLVMNWVTKEYSPELLKMKEEINADPLAKSI